MSDRLYLIPAQSAVLSIIDTHNSIDYDNWFLRSSVMAVVQIESAFRPVAFRFEPTIDDASYGYMQLLSQTARGLGYSGPCYPNMPVPSALQDNPHALDGTLYDPLINIPLGMRYLREGWDHLTRAFGHPPTLSEWFAGYNEGYGAAARGRPDPSYVHLALAAFDHWLVTLDETDRASVLER